MKKRLFITILAIVMALACVCGLVACNGDDVEGTYYVYMNGEKQDDMTMKLDGGKVTMTQSMGEQSVTIDGTYEVSGKTVTIKVSLGGVSSSQKLTIVSDGVLKDPDGLYYCKDGKTPPQDSEEEDE